MAPLPPVAAGTWNSVMAVFRVKLLAGTAPVPKSGAASVPRMVTVTEEGVPMVAETDPTVTMRSRACLH